VTAADKARPGENCRAGWNSIERRVYFERPSGAEPTEVSFRPLPGASRNAATATASSNKAMSPIDDLRIGTERGCSREVTDTRCDYASSSSSRTASSGGRVSDHKVVKAIIPHKAA
jgi:hypothetical protein